MNISGSVALVTGANRGLGRSLVQALVARGAERVYAAARDPLSLDEVVHIDRARIVAVELDVTRPEQIDAAAHGAGDATLLINNAAAANFAPSLDGDRNGMVAAMATNYLGTFDMIRAFVPLLERNGGGAVVNVMSLLALAGSPGLDGYGASKAALRSLTQALRPALAERGIAIHSVYPGGIDSEMNRHIRERGPVSAPTTVANGVLDGVEGGQDDIFPDPMSQLVSSIWWSEPKRYERLFADPHELRAFFDQARHDGQLVMDFWE